MSNDTRVFSGQLKNEVNYEIHQSSSFSGREEIALMVEGEIVSVWNVEIKKTGTIECKPMSHKTCRITKMGVDIKEEDVMDVNKPEL